MLKRPRPPTEQNWEPRNKPSHIRSTKIRQGSQEYSGKKRQFLQEMVLGKLDMHMEQKETGPLPFFLALIPGFRSRQEGWNRISLKWIACFVPRGTYDSPRIIFILPPISLLKTPNARPWVLPAAKVSLPCQSTQPPGARSVPSFPHFVCVPRVAVCICMFVVCVYLFSKALRTRFKCGLQIFFSFSRDSKFRLTNTLAFLNLSYFQEAEMDCQTKVDLWVC